jgi:SAM-dependent methyltransferase
MPFADESFDGAWTQHSTMNIPDKEALYAEIHRVLKPGGRLAMHEVMGGTVEPVDYPQPWATTVDFSFVQPATEMRTLIADAGFRELAWNDETANVIAFTAPADAPPVPGSAALPPGQIVLFGPAFQERIRNLGMDLRQDKLAVIQALFERV